MPGHYLAAYTFNEFLDRYQSDLIKGFREAEPDAYRAIEAAEGFVSRSGYDGEPGPESLGGTGFPKILETQWRRTCAVDPFTLDFGRSTDRCDISRYSWQGLQARSRVARPPRTLAELRYLVGLQRPSTRLGRGG